MGKAIYLDVCALCRPFDDQSTMRIRLETNAVYLILEHVRRSTFSMIVSPAHILELGATAYEEEDMELSGFLEKYGTRPRWEASAVREQAERLYCLGFGALDAAHVAFAERAAQVFISCDDALVRKCDRSRIAVPAMGPIEFCVSEALK